MTSKLPPWHDNTGHPGLTTWLMDAPCRKCKGTYVQAAQSSYSGTTYYFCNDCGTDYPDSSGEEENDVALPVYAVLSGTCLNSHNDQQRTFNVVMRFDSEAELNLVEGSMFDTVYGSFNAALPDGWFIDEAPEIVDTISKDEAEARGYCVYKSDML